MKSLMTLILWMFTGHLMAGTPFSAGTLNENECKDSIYLSDGRAFPITYVKETGMTVKYYKCDDPLNRKWTKEKSKVERVVLSSGEIKDYSHVRSDAEAAKNAGIINATPAVMVLAIILGVLFTGLIGLWMALNALG